MQSQPVASRRQRVRNPEFQQGGDPIIAIDRPRTHRRRRQTGKQDSPNLSAHVPIQSPLHGSQIPGGNVSKVEGSETNPGQRHRLVQSEVLRLNTRSRFITGASIRLAIHVNRLRCRRRGG